ncbi:putative disease resistance protein RGA3 isoform X1 [Quercus robur]|uniref:putative disease resistance protein RGA3 isoform X1 n=1 Tax=Quercus robur TaxID=38942 RepID=UPI00216133D5|nr:putative disease resistance protein RGA3 isoform X1 [Quercus robur]
MAEAVAVAVAGHILTGIAKKIGEMLGSTAFEGIGSICAVKDEFQKLKGTLSTIEAVFKDAEEKQDKNHQLRDWLTKLRDAVYDVDDLLADFETEDLRRRAMGKMAKKVRTFKLAFSLRRKMAKKIKVMRKRFDAIAKDRINFQLVEQGPSETVTRERDQTYSLVHEEEVFGRKDDKEILINLLLDSKVEENVSFLSIVGIGGMGKTTLAQYVYNDKRVLDYFDLRMWVCVSDVFDVKTIAEKIIRCADVSKHENLDK